jgi:hypothetical protein
MLDRKVNIATGWATIMPTKIANPNLIKNAKDLTSLIKSLE